MKTLFFDTNAWISLIQDIADQRLGVLTRMVILNRADYSISYNNVLLTELVGTNRLQSFLSRVALLQSLPSLVFYDVETKKFNESNREELLSRFFYKYFCYSPKKSRKQFKKFVDQNIELKRLYKKYKNLASEDLELLTAKISQIDTKRLQEFYGVHKGQYNHLPFHEAKVKFKEAYKKVYSENKSEFDEAGLPSDLFSRAYFDAKNFESSEVSYEVVTSYLMDILGYHQKKQKPQTNVLNPIADSLLLAMAADHDIFVTSDRKLIERIETENFSCEVFSYESFKEKIMN